MSADDRLPTPPRAVTDDEGRTVHLRTTDEPSDERTALATMYDAFGRADRAQGVPPTDDDRRRRWLDRLDPAVEVVPWHGDRAVGHGVLLGDSASKCPHHELALFVHPDFRRAGVGTELLRTLLGRGRSAGVERVWLSVERTNRAAVRLYRNAGFSRTATEDAELEMMRSLG